MLKKVKLTKRNSAILISVSFVFLCVIGVVIQKSVSSSRVVLKDELKALREEPDLPTREYLQEFLTESLQKMGRILQDLGGGFISPQVGEPYDPVIHLAVGETEVPGAEEGTVAGVVRPGYKSSRGRVVLPARVLVGKR